MRHCCPAPARAPVAAARAPVAASRAPLAPARAHTASASTRAAGGEAGQATVELVALLPLAGVIALAIGQLLAAGSARELAGNAAEAGAAAILQGADPTAAARAALPGWSRGRALISVTGRHVEVRLRPRVLTPILADTLTARATADAGPQP